jgi:hypothetical protein
VYLVDHKKGIKSGWQVPIKVEVLYSSTNELVADQSILELDTGDSEPTLGHDGSVCATLFHHLLRESRALMSHSSCIEIGTITLSYA